MIRVAVMIMTHDRGDQNRALRMCIEHLKNADAARDAGVHFTPVFFHSAGEDAREMLHVGHHHYITNEQPTGARNNAAMDWLLSEYTWDYVMQLGSDDVITPSGYLTIAAAMRAGIAAAGFNTVGIVNGNTGKWVLYQCPGVMGAGRFIRRDIVVKCHNPAEHRRLWKPHRMKGLDGTSEGQLIWNGRTAVQPLNIGGCHVFDLKYGENISPYSNFTDGRLEMDFDPALLTQGYMKR